MTLHGKNLIAEHLSTGTNETFSVTSPLDGTPLPCAFHTAGPADADAALRAANSASDAFRNATGEQRAKLLELMAEEIIALGDTLLDRAHRETGLPLPRLTGERGRTVNQLRMFAQVAREESWLDLRI